MTKSSLLTRLSNAVTATPLTPAEITQRIDLAAARVAELERKRPDLALAAVTDGSDDARVTALDAELREARGKLALLRDALTAAQNHAATRDREARDTLRQTLLAAKRKHFELRDAAGVRIAEGIAALVEDWKLLTKHSEAAAGGRSMDGAYGSVSELAGLIAQEFDRHANGDIGATRFPCSAHGPGAAFDPTTLLPLVSLLKQASAHMLKREQEGWSP
ncbi:MAG TPA: hypothetical protein VII56_01130 [Rhizomicrobium sp.]